MPQARVVVELMANDRSAERFLYSLEQEFGAGSVGAQCTVVRKEEFEVEKNFEQGAFRAMQGALETSLPWCLYVAPRQLILVINKVTQFPVNATLIAVARRQKPAAFFLHTLTEMEVPEEITSVLFDKVDSARKAFVSMNLSARDETVIDWFRSAIAMAYVKALNGSFIN